MYLIVPLLLIIISVVGILAIILRKKSYLNKLYLIDTAGSGETTLGSGKFSWPAYGAELFPEIKSFLDKIHFNQYKTSWLIEVEKLLRRIRLMFLRVDRLSGTLISKVRRVHLNDRLSSQSESIDRLHDKPEEVRSEKGISSTFLKNEEQRLIMEIAKSPKSAHLYEELGDVYSELKSFIDAKESYEAAIELDPNNESIKQKLSGVLEHTDKSEA